MGYARLIWIYEDALEDVAPGDERWESLQSELGEGILKLIQDVRSYAVPGGKRRTSQSLGHTSNAINYCDEVHSSDDRLYLWSGNRLVPLQKADPDELPLAQKLLEEVVDSHERT